MKKKTSALLLTSLESKLPSNSLPDQTTLPAPDPLITMTAPVTKAAPAWVWIGIDVSKLTLDVCLMLAEDQLKKGQFANDKKGFTSLIKWLKRYAPEVSWHFCMEATGAYSYAAAVFLTEAGYLVSVINPFWARHAALAKGSENKTDAIDARDLADYCRKEQPRQWRMVAPEVRTLTALVRHLDNLTQSRVQQHNRLSEPDLEPLVEASLTKLLQQTEDEIRDIEKKIQKHIGSHPDLKADRDLLVSIPGIADTTAARILAEMPDVKEFANSAQVVSYAGLNPIECRSGTSVHKRPRLSKHGNVHLRTGLYMPALTAMTHNPLIKAFADRLRKAGKHGSVIRGAVMRKLLVLAYGVLHSRQPFRENYFTPMLKKA